MKQLSRQDPVFGTIRYIEVANPSNNYWEGMVSVSVKNQAFILEIFIDGDKDGPTAIQRDFFKEIRSRFADICASSRPLLNMARFGENNRELASNQEPDFQARALWIPKMQAIPPKSWELCFKAEEERSYSITFEGWDPANIQLE